MIKDLKEKREVEVEIRKTFCDVCGDLIASGNTKIRLSVNREPYEYGRPQRSSIEDPLDICGTECIKTNLSGLIMILQSKIIPTTPSAEGTKTEKEGYITRMDLSDCKAEAPPSSGFSLGTAAASIKLRS